MGPLVKVISFFAIEQPKVIVIVNKEILLDVGLVDHGSPWSQTHPEVIEEVVDRLFKIRGVHVIADDNLLDGDFLEP